MRRPYSTKLEETIVKKLKFQSVEEERNANDIIEEALNDYFKKKGVDKD